MKKAYKRLEQGEEKHIFKEILEISQGTGWRSVSVMQEEYTFQELNGGGLAVFTFDNAKNIFLIETDGKEKCPKFLERIQEWILNKEFTLVPYGKEHGGQLYLPKDSNPKTEIEKLSTCIENLVEKHYLKALKLGDNSKFSIYHEIDAAEIVIYMNSIEGIDRYLLMVRLDEMGTLDAFFQDLLDFTSSRGYFLIEEMTPVENVPAKVILPKIEESFGFLFPKKETVEEEFDILVERIKGIDVQYGFKFLIRGLNEKSFGINSSTNELIEIRILKSFTGHPKLIISQINGRQNFSALYYNLVKFMCRRDYSKIEDESKTSATDLAHKAIAYISSKEIETQLDKYSQDDDVDLVMLEIAAITREYILTNFPEVKGSVGLEAVDILFTFPEINSFISGEVK